MTIKKMNNEIWDELMIQVGNLQDTLTGTGGLSQSISDSSGSGGWPEASWSLQTGYSDLITAYELDAERPSTATVYEWPKD